MPRVTRPTDSQVLAHARAFALLQQVPDSSIEALAAKYAPAGSDNAVNSAMAKSELSFEDFATLFTLPSTQAEQGAGNCLGLAAFESAGELKTWRFDRRATLPTDVRIQITHAGICHSDIHQVKNEWKGSKYPMVPGHEIAGIVTEIGSDVTKFKVGDRVGVGCMVNSCQDCDACLVLKEEQYCSKGMVGTYNGTDKDGSVTQGGYSSHVLVNENFVLNVPAKLALSDAAPLLCAGITVYSPIRKFGFDKPGMSVGVVGLGGLGHMAVKILKAMGVTTTIISTSVSKKEEAISVLGADQFLVSKDEAQMKAAAGTLDGIVNTISAQYDPNVYMSLLKVDGTMVCVGAPPEPPAMPTWQMIMQRKRIAGSLIGGIAETQEMLDFCAENGVACMTETINADYANTAYARVIKSDVRYRFVIDVQGSLIN